jgi:hypothetical protein
MKLFRRATPAGRARCAAADPELALAAIEAGAHLAAGGRAFAGPAELLGSPAWVKAGALRGKSRLRHAARRWLLARPPPREAECQNLAWLARRHFRVPEPRAAVSFWRGGLPHYQALWLERLPPGAEPLSARLPALAPPERDELLLELAREVARMHALGFAHRDLYLRNVLVAAGEGGGPRRLVFLDAWSGGPGRARRGEARDLACLMLEGANLLSEPEQSSWLARYLAERAALEAPAAAGALLRRAARERAALLGRIEREPGRWRLAEPPRRGWSWPSS